MWRGKSANWEFRDDRTSEGENLFCQPLVLLRIYLIDARAPDGYCFPLGRNRAAVPGSIDTSCHTAENYQSTGREIAGQPLRHT